MMKDLLKESDDYKLLLVGPIHDKGKCQELVKKMNMENNVLFLGWRSDIVELLSIGDIYVASSVREGLGLNLIEAQYCGLPVIASNNRGHNEIIKDGFNGYLVKHNDFEKFKDKVKYITENNDICDQIIENANKTSLKFSQEEALKNIKKLYMFCLLKQNI